MKKRYYGLPTDAVSQREADNRRLAYEVAAEGIILLKNDGVLPFRGEEIALYGAGARMTIKGGTGSGDVLERYSVNVEEGLQNAGIRVLSRNWLNKGSDAYQKAKTEWENEIEEKVRKYKVWEVQKMFDEVINPSHFNYVEKTPIEREDLVRCDTCIYVIARQAGESSDRRHEKGDYLLSDEEVKSIRYLQENYDKVILVINAGSQVELSGIDLERVNAVLYMMQAGEEGGNALADIITGKVNPSGKLTDSWADKYDDYYGHEKYGILGNVLSQDYEEGIYVGYRYFDTFGVKPLFGFGYGLSYSDFRIETEEVRAEGTKVTACVRVTNLSERHAGKETVQLYVARPQGRIPNEKRMLAGFAKTSLLQPGESETVEIFFDFSSLKNYDEESASFILQKGEYGIFVGSSLESSEAVSVIHLDEEAVLEKCANKCVKQGSFEDLVSPFEGYEYEKSLPRLAMHASDFVTVEHHYEGRELLVQNEKVREYLNTLTDEELITLTVGGGYGAGDINITPSVAGKTTTKLTKKGIVNINLTDGPAGLRLSQKNAFTKILGMQRYIDHVPENWRWGWIRKVEPLFLARSNNLRKVYQYMTAFPCAFLQASTWNEELIERVGKGIALEMIETGCTLWLAPGMNIHRNPLCGRNFEYYSEDPLISGRFASAVTKGVQSFKGIGTTIKHFCCNNQEDKREYMSSNVSERALREIYLRGFEIAVKEAHPLSIMSSYNKLNEVYTPNNRDLCVDILRTEWGFEGLVMTDWGSCGDGKGDITLCHKAGNDLIEPGGDAIVNVMLEAYKAGKVDMEEIRKSAANVLNVIVNSRVS